jgi:hypothetical protein
MHDHARMLFIVCWCRSDATVDLVGAFEDYRDAERKQKERPELYEIQLVPYYPSPPLEP